MKNALVDYKTENDHQRMQCANEIFSVGHRDFMSFEQRNTIKIFIFIMDDKNKLFYVYNQTTNTQQKSDCVFGSLQY